MPIYLKMLYYLIAAAEAYLIGSVSTGILVGKFFKKDVRKMGSGNAGMTNALRSLGWAPGLITLVGDLLKGVVAVGLARLLFHCVGIPTIYAVYAAGFFVVIGHMYPLYFGFKGGKGISTGLGVGLMLHPVIGLGLIIAFVPAALITKIVSLGSIIAAVAFPVITFLFLFFTGQPWLWSTVFALVTGGLVIFAHRSNLKRLINRTEKPLTVKKKSVDN